MSKSDLKARPVFHRTREAIEAHLTIVMAALAVSHRLQTITEKSVAEIIETLEPLHEMNVNIAGRTLHAHDQITPAAQTILDALGLTWPPHQNGTSQEKRGTARPAMIGLWRNAWTGSVPFLDYDIEIREVLCGTNAIESPNARFRRAVRAKGRFPNEQSAS